SGNLPEFRSARLGFFTQCVRDYGDIVRVRFEPRRVYIVAHPDLIEEVLVARSREVIKHFALRLNPLVFGNGLLTSEGDFWLRQRRLIQPVFNRGRIAGYAAAMVAAARHVTGAWRPGERRDILVEMLRLTLEIAAKTLFDADVADAQSVVDALQVMQDNFLTRFASLWPIPIWIPTPGNIRLRRAV